MRDLPLECRNARVRNLMRLKERSKYRHIWKLITEILQELKYEPQ